MKEITKVTVPGTLVTITIMKTVDGMWNVSNTAQLGIARARSASFYTEEQAAKHAKLLWTWAVETRNAQISTADDTALDNFEQAIDHNKFIIEVRFE